MNPGRPTNSGRTTPAIEPAIAAAVEDMLKYGRGTVEWSAKTLGVKHVSVQEPCFEWNGLRGPLWRVTQVPCLESVDKESQSMSEGLPTNKSREELAIWDYLFGYFPDAFMAELSVSVTGNRQHNPGQPMHWAREKSKDHKNKALRHIWDYGRGVKKDTDGTYHLAKAIWRLKAQLQLDIEAERLEQVEHVCEPWEPHE